MTMGSSLFALLIFRCLEYENFCCDEHGGDGSSIGERRTRYLYWINDANLDEIFVDISRSIEAFVCT